MQRPYTIIRTFVAFFFLFPLLCFSQSDVSFWTNRTTESTSHQKSSQALITAHKAEYLTLDYQALHTKIFSGDLTDFILELPLENGRFHRFTLVDNTLVPSALNRKFPEVRAYNIVSTESRSIWGKFEISPKGIHAMIFQPGKSTFFIDPLYRNNTEEYIAYSRKDFYTDKVIDCQVEANPFDKPSSKGENPKTDYNSCELRTYRLALAVMGEYTIFHGGTAADAFDAMVTTMNRVNGVFEREMAITMVMIENTDTLIFTDPDTDPYTNPQNNIITINENKYVMFYRIGVDNFDIGHVFGTGGGGTASLGGVCQDYSKAQAVTGMAAPIGDPFDIDYVSHEMGHQYGGQHSFNNSCGAAAYTGSMVEPGSGSTIMAYAGVCSPNIQLHSDDYFHGVSLKQMGGLFNIDTYTCTVKSPLENNSPYLAELPNIIYVPVSTPFALRGHASDIDGDLLTYCWEGLNQDFSTQPPLANAPSGPNFRSLPPSVDSIRYFPNLHDLANGGPFTWEQIPSVPRTLKFRLTVRDNAPGGGCTQFEDMKVITVGGSGPFEVLYPSDSGIEWNGLESETVTWNVANTALSPINATMVDIFLSTDGGNTYPILLANNVLNTGSISIQAPNVATFEARIMVMNATGDFFDISDHNFTINSIEDGFIFTADVLDYALCQNETVTLDLSIAGVGDFADPIHLSLTELPLNAVAALSTDQVNAGDAFTISVSSLVNTAPGIYPLTVSGVGTSFSNTMTTAILVIASNPVVPQLTSPQNYASNITVNPLLEWEDNLGLLETFNLQVSDNPGFSNLITNLTDVDVNSYQLTGLAENTTYYWRMSKSTPCSQSAYSQVFRFATVACNSNISDDPPFWFSSTEPSSVTSQIDVTDEGVIADVNVTIWGSHTRIAELTFVMKSPSGTEVNLVSAMCGSNVTIAQNGEVIVNSSNGSATYQSSGAAQFGPSIPSTGITGDVILGHGESDTYTIKLCDAAINAAELQGNIALVSAGDCEFTTKVQNAQDAGAIAVIVMNDMYDEGFYDMEGTSSTISIPSVMISYEDGNEIYALTNQIHGGSFSLALDDQAESGIFSCPPENGDPHQPMEPLSIFNGENPQGIWTITAADNTYSNGGGFSKWRLDLCVNGAVGVDEYASQSALIYPNPTRYYLTIKLNGLVRSENIMILDLLGRVLLEEKVSGRTIIELNVSGFTSGVYLIRLDGKEIDAKVYKFIKE